MQHLMVDLETLGTSPTAVIVQLGAVKFDPADGGVGMWTTLAPSTHVRPDIHFERTISIASNLAFGRTVDGSTIEWWLGQSEAARRSITGPSVNLAIALYDFAAWVHGTAVANPVSPDDIAIWSHGAAFDVVILEDAFRSVDLPIPWGHRSARDTRTLFWLAETLSNWKKPVRETAHTALADAIAQVKDVRSAFKALRDRNSIHSFEDVKGEFTTMGPR